PVHGFPLRAVVPGWIGARSVKWLGRITLLDEPSSNYFQSRAYRMQREINPRDARDVSAGIALSGVPLNAIILAPTREQVISPGRVEVRGWAMGSGGPPLTAVEVSTNAGDDWIPAEISVEGSAWTWSFWEARLELAPGRHTLAARALDDSGTIEPATLSAAWNVKGYSNSAWHRITVCAQESRTSPGCEASGKRLRIRDDLRPRAPARHRPRRPVRRVRATFRGSDRVLQPD